MTHVQVEEFETASENGARIFSVGHRQRLVLHSLKTINKREMYESRQKVEGVTPMRCLIYTI